MARDNPAVHDDDDRSPGDPGRAADSLAGVEAIEGAVEPIDDGVRVRLLVVPRASRTKVVGVHDGRVKMQVAAPPVDGKANAVLVRHLAKQLGVRRTAVEVTSGATGRRKTMTIHGASVAEVRRALGLDGA